MTENTSKFREKLPIQMANREISEGLVSSFLPREVTRTLYIRGMIFVGQKCLAEYDTFGSRGYNFKISYCIHTKTFGVDYS